MTLNQKFHDMLGIMSKRMTERQIALKCGVSPATLNKLVHQEDRSPSLETYQKVQDFYNREFNGDRR